MFHAGNTLEQYKLLSELGSGAYGTVFAAENTVTGQRCALKIVSMSGLAGQRELRALKAYREISHPNLLKIHHTGICGDYLYYTMDLAEGKLEEMQLSPAALRRSAIEIADALSALHAAGLLHRDIKPDNLFFRDGKALLGDIGLLTAADNPSLSGTPGFLSPKIRVDGAVPDAESDLYALAKTFYCLLSHNPPAQYPKYRGALDEDASCLFDAVIRVCDGKSSIHSAAEFRDRLKEKRPRTHFLPLWGIAALLLLLLAAGTAFFLFRAPEQKEFKPNPLEELQKKQARKAANKKFPGRNGRIRLDEVLKREAFYEEYLKKLQQQERPSSLTTPETPQN